MPIKLVQNPDGTMQCELPSDLSLAKQVVDALVDVVIQVCQFLDKEIRDVHLALEEAIVNAIKHGNKLEREKMVRISGRIKKQRCEFRIVDEGPGHNPEEVPDPLADENLTKPSGRGLFFMRHYMSNVTVEPPGNAVSMVKIPKSEATSPEKTAESPLHAQDLPA